MSVYLSYVLTQNSFYLVFMSRHMYRARLGFEEGSGDCGEDEEREKDSHYLLPTYLLDTPYRIRIQTLYCDRMKIKPSLINRSNKRAFCTTHVTFIHL